MIVHFYGGRFANNLSPFGLDYLWNLVGSIRPIVGVLSEWALLHLSIQKLLLPFGYVRVV